MNAFDVYVGIVSPNLLFTNYIHTYIIVRQRILTEHTVLLGTYTHLHIYISAYALLIIFNHVLL